MNKVLKNEITLFGKESVDTLCKAMPAYRVFDNIVDAEAYLETISGKTDGLFGLHTIRTYEQDNVKWDDHPVCVARVGTTRPKPEGESGRDSGVKAILVFPHPTVESFTGSDAGVAFLDKIASKEIRHDYFRGYREAETLEELHNATQIAPKTVEEFATISSTAASQDEFNTVYTAVRAQLFSDATPFGAMRGILPAKSDFVRAIRSKSFAESVYPKLECVPGFDQSIFELFAAYCIDAIETAGLDTTPVQLWVDGRNELNLTPPATADSVDFNAIDFSEYKD